MNTTKQLLKTASPIYLSSVFATAYNVINIGIIAKNMSKSAVAAVGISATLMFLMQGLSLGLSSGFLAKISRDKTFVTSSLIITILFSAVISALTFMFLPKIVSLLNAKDKVFELTLKYLRVSVGGFIFLSLYRLFESWLYALGKSVVSMWFSLGLSVLQVALTFTLVKGFGISGAAFANIISFAVCGGAMFFYIRHRHKSFFPKHFKFKKQKFKNALKGSLPLSLMQLFKGLGLVSVQMSVGAMGKDALAAFAACQKVSHISTDGAVAISNASIRLFSKEKNQSPKPAVFVGVLFSVITGLLLFLGASPLSKIIFNSDKNILKLVKDYFLIISPFFSVLYTMVILRARFVAKGHPYVALTEGVLEFITRVSLLLFITEFKYTALIFGLSWTVGLLFVAIKKRH